MIQIKTQIQICVKRVLAVAALAVALVASAREGSGFHGSLSCLECHGRLAATGPGRLKGRDETALCLNCHQGRGDAPDVMHAGSSGRRIVGLDAGRPAGGLNRVGDTSSAEGGYGEWTGHTLGSTTPPPGFAGTWKGGPLTCKSCHAVHPNGNFANLGPDPYLTDPTYLALTGSVYRGALLPRAALDGGEGVALVPGADAIAPPVAGSVDPANRIVLATNGGRNAMNRFCASCHPLFHGAENTVSSHGTAGAHYGRHPTSGVAIVGATREALEDVAQPMRVVRRDGSTAEVGCLTCHRAHGSRHPFALIWWDRRAAVNGEDGAGTSAESLCLSCHRVNDDPVAVAAVPGR